MARTIKNGILKRKKLQHSSSKIKGADMRGFYKDIAHKNFENAKNEGWIIERVNPLGKVYYWYRKGRKVCFETRIKLDKDGYDRWNNNMKHLRIFKHIKK